MSDNNSNPTFYEPDKNKSKTYFRSTKKYSTVQRFIYNSTLSAFNNNAYRILGLPTNASEDSIIAQSDTLKRKIKLGIEQRAAFGVNLLEDIAIDEKAVISAVNRLRQPESRLFEKLCWFSSLENWPISDLSAADITLDDYIDLFNETIADNLHSYSFETLYDMALFGLVILNIDDYPMKHVNTWANVYNLLIYIYEQDLFWDELSAAEAEGGFAINVNNIADNSFRDLAIDRMLSPFKKLLDKHLNENISSAGRCLQILLKFDLEDQFMQSILGSALDKLEDDIKQVCDSSIGYCNENTTRDNYSQENNEKACAAAYGMFENGSSSKLKLFWKYADHPLRKKRMKELIAAFYYKMAVNYTWADNYLEARKLLFKAKVLLVDGTAEAQKVDALLSRVEYSVDLQHRAEMKKAGTRTSNPVTIDALGRAHPDVAAVVAPPTTTEAINDSDDSKACPFCKSVIPRNAVRCKFCDMILEENLQPGSIGNEEKDKNYWWVAVVAGIILFFIFISSGNDSAGNDSAGNDVAVNKSAPSTESRQTETITYANAVYEGEVRNGVPHGNGTLTFKNGNKYVGQFKDDEYHGQGTLTFNNGDKYVGQFKDGKFDGQGTFTFDNGNKYVGRFSNNYFHGQGTLTLKNGDKYVGQFKDDEYHGQGTLTWHDGTKFTCNWTSGRPSGHGIYYFTNGDRVEGNWTSTTSANNATYIFYNGMRETGVVKNGEFVPY